MSQPEWMQKFKEIGQKSQKFDAEGNPIVESIDDKFKKRGSVANASVPEWMTKNLNKAEAKGEAGDGGEKPEWMKKTLNKTEAGDSDDDAAALFAAAATKPAVIETDDDDDDAAALFAAAASKPAVIKTDDAALTDEEEELVTRYKKMFKMGMPEGAVVQKMEVDEVPKHVQDAVLAPVPEAAPATPGALTAEEEEMVTKYKKMFKMGMPEGAVVQKMEVDEVPKHVQDAVLVPAPAEETTASPDAETIEEEIIEEEVIEESVVSSGVVEETVNSGSPTAAEGENPDQETGVVAAVASSSPANSDQKMSDEEFGDTWVVGKDQVAPEETNVEEVEVGQEGDVYEDVYIDENGDEVVVQQGDREINEDEEEIIIDEDGNEVEYEEEEAEEEQVQDEEVQEVEVVAATAREIAKEDEYEEPVEPPYDPDYDVENQLKLLNRRSKAYRSRMAPWVPYVFLFAFIAASILILFFIVLADDDGIDPENLPTAAPTPFDFLPLGPTNTGAIDVSATTPLEPVTGTCNFSRNTQPHVIDQCSCTGSISIIADDVRQRYESLLETFMPSVIPDFDQAIDSCDASNQALVWLSTGLNNAGEAADFVRRERYALAYFYMDQGGVGWSDNSLWISENDACRWDRVSCDQNGRVVSLDVSRNDLIGQLSGAISLMENIESFSAAQNTVVGTIPPEIFGTQKLRSLDLSFNGLAGIVPPFPEDSTLEIINFSSNDLGGNIQTTFGNVESLSSLNLAGNSFNGRIPTELFSLPLQELYLATNALTGVIPDAISDLSMLTALSLGPNKFTGDIPTALGDLKNLTRLVILDVPELTGRLPVEYGLGLTNLRQFVLRDTNVRGNIPQQFGLMTALEILDLGRNSLARAVPTELGLLTNLRILNLENNAFTGTLPNELGNAVELTELKLHVNQMTGTIPSSIGGMSDLATLNLDGNFFNSRAPEEICNLRQEKLNEFTVDCPERVNDVLVVGVICSIPSCCTECY